MFGLTRREQRWKAEQQAAELLAVMAGNALRAVADVRIAEARTNAEELARLRAENEDLRRLAAASKGFDSQHQPSAHRWLTVPNGTKLTSEL